MRRRARASAPPARPPRTLPSCAPGRARQQGSAIVILGRVSRVATSLALSIGAALRSAACRSQQQRRHERAEQLGLSSRRPQAHRRHARGRLPHDLPARRARAGPCWCATRPQPGRNDVAGVMALAGSADHHARLVRACAPGRRGSTPARPRTQSAPRPARAAPAGPCRMRGRGWRGRRRTKPRAAPAAGHLCAPGARERDMVE